MEPSRRWEAISQGLLFAFLLARLAAFFFIRRVGGAVGFFIDPIATLDRLRYAQLWALSPAVVPGDHFGWLPLPSYLNGLLLRLNGDPFVLPVLLNAALSVAVVALVYLIARELFDRPAAAAAAFGAAFSATAILQGLEPSADCLMQALLLGALWCWARHARTGRSALLWGAAACLGLGNAARFEVWAVSAGFTAYAWLKAKRRLPGLAVWLFPAFWMAYGLHARADAFAFLHDTMEIGFFGGPPLHGLAWRYCELAGAFAGCGQSLILLLALLALPECLACGPALWYLSSIPLLAAFFLAANAVMTASVADHLWVFYLLALPLAGAGAMKAWKAAGGRRAVLAAMGAVFVLSAAATLREDVLNDLAARPAWLVQDFLELKRLRQTGGLSSEDRVLVELIPEGDGLPFERLWRMSAAPGLTLFDRNLLIQRDESSGRLRRVLDQADNPSALALPPAARERWLRERGIRLVVTARPRRMDGAWIAWSSRGGRDFWLRAGDPLLRSAARF